MNYENGWKPTAVHVTEHGITIECGSKHCKDTIDHKAEELVEHMNCCGEKLSCKCEEQPAQLASAHAVPMDDKDKDTIDKLLEETFGAVDETPIAKAEAHEDAKIFTVYDCRVMKHMVSIGFSDDEEEGVSIQCSDGAKDNLRASALLKAALFFMPDYNDKKWDEFIELLYELSYLLGVMPNGSVASNQ